MDNKERRVIMPLHLNLGHGKVYIVKFDIVNEELSTSVEAAEIDEVKIRTLDNDEVNRKVIINKGLQGQELELEYDDTTISITEEDARKGAAVSNRQQKRKVQEDMDELTEVMLKLEALMKYFTEELPKEGLI